MAHEHGHSHNHDHNGTPTKALAGAFGVTAVIFLAELIGGIISGSLALLSDAMHMLSDSTGLILALVASMIGSRAASDRATFGHRRVEVLAALVNAVTVTAVTVWIVISAIARLGSSEEIDTRMMLIVAVVGLVANAMSAIILSAHQKSSLNVQGAFLHVIVDLLGSVVVIVAALVISWTGWQAVDTVASLIIVALVLPRALKLLWESLEVLLERVPRDIDIEAIRLRLEEIDHVDAVHDLHVWSTDGVSALATCHVVVDKHWDSGCNVLDSVQAALREFGIEHSTVQMEQPGHVGHEQACY